jgi:ribosomal protein S18 acetylase RimI-like enzyme
MALLFQPGAERAPDASRTCLTFQSRLSRRLRARFPQGVVFPVDSPSETAEKRSRRIMLPVAVGPPMREGCMSNIQPPAWHLRAMAGEDFEGVMAVSDARADKLNALTRQTRKGWQTWWAAQGANLASYNCTALDNTGRIIGSAMVDPPTEPFVATYGGGAVHPDHWDCEELWDALYAWAIARGEADVKLAAPDAQVSLLTETVDGDLRRQAAVARAGFALARIFFRMRMDFDSQPVRPAVPAGVQIRRMDMERELLDVAAVHNEAFRDHWGHTEESPQSLVEQWRKETAGQRLDLNYVAVADGVIAGYVVCQDNYRGDPVVGLVDFLGVRPAWRRRGIAIALLETAFQALHAEGYKTVRLGVDASSPTGATRLYEKAGMHVVEQVNRYEKILRPGRDWLARPSA